MFEPLSDFHFIRPLWLFALVLVVIIIAGFIIKNKGRNQWNQVIDAHLLQHLLVSQQTIKKSIISNTTLLATSLILMVLALAGPSWEKRPLPVFESEISKVILLDLSLSMESTDIKPSRLIRAKHKINDLLNKTKEGQVALIVYAGDAFVISPLTTDAKTILTLVPPLEPSLMPVLGSEPKAAFELADQLLTNAGVFSGQIIWITDGVDNRDYGLVSELIKASRHQISILAVGTSEGAPIPLPDGQGFLKDTQGSIVLPTLNIAPLEQLAALNQGTLTQLTADDSDIDRLLSSLKEPQEFIESDDDLQMDSWVEVGPWLLLPVILFFAFAFRKGLVVVFVFSIFPTTNSSSYAAEEMNTEQSSEVVVEASPWQNDLKSLWTNLWQRPDQQAAVAFDKNDHQSAANLFDQTDWKSAALYKSGQYHAATDLYANQQTATANYNRGNALAQSGRLEESIEAYNKALLEQPEMEDAQFNKALVEELLKQQKENEQQDGEDQKENDQKQDGEQQEGEQEQEDEQQDQNKDGEQQENEEQDQQEQEEKDSEQQESELEKMSEAEREQALEQWLRMIKDDPGGLLRRKMYMEYQKRQQQGKNLQNKGEQVW